MLAHVLLFSRLSPASNQLSGHTLTRADISHLVKVSSYLPHLHSAEVTCFRGESAGHMLLLYGVYSPLKTSMLFAELKFQQKRSYFSNK